MSIKYSGAVVLVILDGYGLSDNPNGNAIMAANKPTLDRISRDYPMQKLKASGTAVGLPNDNEVGNSEVGHNAMGAGQIIKQSLARVDESFQTGAIFQSSTWRDAIANVQSHDGTLHFIGIFSDGGVHSNIHHLEAMLAQAQREGIARARIHVLLDGRDTPPTSALKYVDELETFVKNLGDPDYKIASGGGRMIFWADRYENDWSVVEVGWQASVLGTARPFASARQAIETYRAENPDLEDQYVPPFTIAENGQSIGTIVDGDSVIYYDFRADRAIESAKAFTFDDFSHFDRIRRPDVYFAGMTEYDSDIHVPAHTLVPPIEINGTLNVWLGEHGIAQLAISETVKFGHITYYFNGNSYDLAPGEDQIDIPSYTESFDTRPWMKSAEVTDRLVAEITSNKYQFIRVNFPNPDMVGHFGEMYPTEVAVEAVDIALARIFRAVDETGGMVIITGDHGNAEEMYELNADGSIKEVDGRQVTKSAHTTNRVPCILYDNTPNREHYTVKSGDEFGLANLASTVADLLSVEPRPEWLGSIVEVNRQILD